MPNDPLSQAIETFETHRDQLLADSEGKWAVVHGSAVLGVWDTYEDALQAGYATAGLDPFLVKKIEGVEQLQFITRDVVCRS